jgi:hypothetical protein
MTVEQLRPLEYLTYPLNLYVESDPYQHGYLFAGADCDCGEDHDDNCSCSDHGHHHGKSGKKDKCCKKHKGEKKTKKAK